MDLMDEVFEEYDIENSGFEDSLMDMCFGLCRTESDWRYLLKKLGKHPSDWRKHLSMEILRKELKDGEGYLQLRKQCLHYGMDFWDLASFYLEQGKIEKAVDTAEEGLKKGEGRIQELLFFLFDHYAEKKETVSLERIIRISIERKSEEREMLDRSFAYYRKSGDYENAKNALIREFEYVKGPDLIPEVRSYELYLKAARFLKIEDWNTMEPGILEKIKDKDIEDYMKICLKNDRKEELLNILLNPSKMKTRHPWIVRMTDEYDKFAIALERDHPYEIIEYYWKKADRFIQKKERKNYTIAVGYLERMKRIYQDILNEREEWTRRIAGLRGKYKTRKAFLEEVGKL